MNNITYYHCHSDLSMLDCATKFYKYLDVAQEYKMKAFCFSEHGNVMNWVKKKQEIEKRGMKYIHGIECYVTESLENKTRDNYHMILIAKNWEGVKEINKMSSKGFIKQDGHFYYDARFSMDEIINTSENIIITTSCLGGVLAKGRRIKAENVVDKFLDFAIKNKHRVFLEIQYHNYHEQIDYNYYLYELAKEYGFNLIAGTDTHALDKKYDKARKILMQAKGIQFQDEDKFDLTFKSYNEVVEMFDNQNKMSEDEDIITLSYKMNNKYKLLPKEVYLDAIEFTNTMADMVEEFKIDKSAKYPKMGEDSEEVFKRKIDEGFIKRGFDKFSANKRKHYKEIITEEIEVYKKLNAIDYMLFQEDVISWAKSKGIYHGYGRGSVNGSIIAYMLGITEMDSIKHKLNFFRFLNPERISLADIDIDYPPSRRQEVIDYVASKEGIYFSEIITFNTVAEKGAIREVGRALKMELSVIDEIAKCVDLKDWDDSLRPMYKERYPELFEYIDLLNGVNTSVGSHPSGFLISPIPLDENIGTFYTSNSKYCVSQINMKEIDGINFVKLDMLGLANIEIINNTCQLADIERLTPDNVNYADADVWESIRQSGLNIFQWESPSAQAYCKELFKPETIRRIKEVNPDFSYIDLFSIGNGAIRPSGDSYRNDLANGIFKNNGHEALDKFLKDTMGYLVYQEQIMNWLVEFCGFSRAESDSVRRGIAKKEDTQQFLKPIEDGFLKLMSEKYGVEKSVAKQILESFLQVIDDASLYGFSLNHSQPYSLIGYVCGYLRYYYPLEFLTSSLNINDDDVDKTAKIVEYARHHNIEIKPIKFRKSEAKYSCSKEESCIYKGIGSIKYLNTKISEELKELGNKEYDSFISLLIDIEEATSVNSRQLNILIRLGFFSEFGGIAFLLDICNEFFDGKNKYDKKHKYKTKEKRIPLLKEYEANIPKDKKINIQEQLWLEKDVLGYMETKFPQLQKSLLFITEIDTKYRPKITSYILKTGETFVFKVDKKKFFDKNDEQIFDVGDVIKIEKMVQKNRVKKTNDKVNYPSGWQPIPDEYEYLLEKRKMVRRWKRELTS